MIADPKEPLSRSVISVNVGLPGSSDVKESACEARDSGSIPRLGRFPRVGNGNPLQYSCLEDSMDSGAWRATVHGVTKSRTRLSDFHFHSLPTKLTVEHRAGSSARPGSPRSGFL